MFDGGFVGLSGVYAYNTQIVSTPDVSRSCSNLSDMPVRAVPGGKLNRGTMVRFLSISSLFQWGFLFKLRNCRST